MSYKNMVQVMSKKTIVLQILVTVFFTFNVSAQKDSVLIKGHREVWYEPQPKGMVFIPQGSFQMKEDTGSRYVSLPSFWMSGEITNMEYREFTDYAKAHLNEVIKWNEWNGYVNEKRTPVTTPRQSTYGEILNDISVDTLALSKEYMPGDENYNKYKNYFTNPDFDKYPVVGVSYIGARFFCLWKTIQENEINKTKNEALIQDYRVPVLEEWCYAASECETSKKSPEPEIRDVKYYKEGKIGLCNVSGNVSEWSCSDNSVLSEKYVMGGSWKDNKSFQDRSKIDINTKSGLVGFRIVRSYLRKDFNK